MKMAQLEAKLLGEDKRDLYCSSSEDDEDGTSDGFQPTPPQSAGSSSSAPGISRNTGPKGVLQDWNLFQESEKRKIIEKDEELRALCKATALTCLSEREEAELRAAAEDDELFSDDTLRDFAKARMAEMMKRQNTLPEYGDVLEIHSGEEYLQVIDDTSPLVAVFMHIYDSRIQECVRLNDILITLSSNHSRARFCKIRATDLPVTSQFKKQGVPALLVYKGGNLIGNFPGLREEFGSEFYVGDVENYLIESGMLEDKANLPTLWKNNI